MSFAGTLDFPPLSDTDRVACVSDLAKIGRVLQFAQKGLCLELDVRGRRWKLPNPTAHFGARLTAMAPVLEKLTSVVSTFGLDPDLQITIGSILEQQQSLLTTWAALCAPDLLSSISFSTKLDGAQVAGKRAAVLIPTSVVIGDYRLLVAFALCGNAHWDASDARMPALIRILDGDVRILWREVLRSDPPTDDELAGLAIRLHDAAEQLKSEGFEIASGPAPSALSQMFRLTA